MDAERDNFIIWFNTVGATFEPDIHKAWAIWYTIRNHVWREPEHAVEKE